MTPRINGTKCPHTLVDDEERKATRLSLVELRGKKYTNKRLQKRSAGGGEGADLA